MNELCIRNGCYMFPEGSNERADCERKCRIEKSHDDINLRRLAKSVGFIGTCSGRFGTSRPNQIYGVPRQDRIARGDPETAEPLDWDIDYRDLELRTLSSLGLPKEILEGSPENATSSIALEAARFRKKSEDT